MALQKKETWKMKKWFSVYAPSEFNTAMIGEMPANDDEAAMGRSIVVSLDALTHNPSHAYTNVKFKITGINGTSANTKLVSMEQLYSYIRSLVRKYRSVATLVQNVQTKDDVKMVVKLLIVTRQRATARKIVGIRKEATEIAKGYFLENNASAIIAAILEGKFQSDLASRLNHIAPLNKIEVRKLEVIQT
jgi:small subunit ribosomal protein S3Ae